MKQPRLIGEIIAEIMADLKELQDKYDRDCDDDILSCKAAAQYIGKSPVTVSRYVSEGKLTKVCVRGKVGIRKTQLQQYIRLAKAKSDSSSGKKSHSRGER